MSLASGLQDYRLHPSANVGRGRRERAAPKMRVPESGFFLTLDQLWATPFKFLGSIPPLRGFGSPYRASSGQIRRSSA